jgi:hypothetical protein
MNHEHPDVRFGIHQAKMCGLINHYTWQMVRITSQVPVSEAGPSPGILLGFSLWDVQDPIEK